MQLTKMDEHLDIKGFVHFLFLDKKPKDTQNFAD